LTRALRYTLLVFILLGLSACGESAAISAPTGDVRQITVLYTNDEHGWMEGMQEGTGAANLLGLWREEHGYQPGNGFLVLSGGDNWIGPAVSTWFEGQSMVEVMNAMGYAASVIGNHEFDFGLEAMQTRLSEASFPYLSANLRNGDSGITPMELGIQPYILLEVDGVKVGITGLTTTLTPYVTNPKNLVGLDFIDYETALRQYVPELQALGAQLILVPAHVCTIELYALAHQIKDLGVHMLGGGHCNELLADEAGDIAIISGGYHYTSYAYATFNIDVQSGAVKISDVGIGQNKGGTADKQVAAVMDRWADEAEAELNVTIGYLENDIPRRSRSMEVLITETWLLGYPNADVAIANWGGMRDSLPSGDLTLADVISMLPFNNFLVELKLKGAQLEQVLNFGFQDPAVGGVHQQAGQWVLNASNKPLKGDAIYSVLVSDFMYAGGDNYTMLARFDPQAYNTAIDWRQPIIDWILTQDSSSQNPLDSALESLGN